MTDTPASADRSLSPDAAMSDPQLLARFNEMNTGTLGERMGIEFLQASAERVVARMPVEGNTQPYGLLHGGASVVLAESVGSVGAALHAGERGIAVGLDINATHHRAARHGHVTATAIALSLGRTLASYDVTILDDDGRRICTSRITCMIRAAAPGA